MMLKPPSLHAEGPTPQSYSMLGTNEVEMVDLLAQEDSEEEHQPNASDAEEMDAVTHDAGNTTRIKTIFKMVLIVVGIVAVLTVTIRLAVHFIEGLSKIKFPDMHNATVHNDTSTIDDDDDDDQNP